MNEPKPARAPRLWFDDQWHNEPWLVSSSVPSAYVISPRRNRTHGDELADAPPCPAHVLGFDAVLARIVRCGPHAATERHFEAVEAHTVEEGAVGVCAPRCVCFGCAQARGQLLGNLLRRSAEVNDAPVGVVVQVLETAEPVEVVHAVFPSRRKVEARLRG